MTRPLARGAGVIFIVMALTLAVLMVATLGGALRVYGTWDMYLLVVPLPVLLGNRVPPSGSLIVPLVVLWSGWTYWRVGWDRVLPRGAAALQVLGVTLYAWGFWQGNADCHTYVHDGLCDLVGVFISMAGLVPFGLGTVLLVGRRVARRPG